MLTLLFAELFCIVLIYIWRKLQDISIEYDDEKLYNFSVDVMTIWLVWMLISPLLYILFVY